MTIDKPVTKVIKIDLVAESNTLTEYQIDRIQEVVYQLSKHSTNAQAITLAHNLRNSDSYDDRRKWIVLYYISCFQLLSFINMAKMDKFADWSNKDFNEEVQRLFKEIT